ncbi:MAG: hypothetical protein KGJ86_03090 [Chloroflexota bacterium]|nr:hypothetical protein [Chloroflexota bacterium]
MSAKVAMMSNEREAPGHLQAPAAHVEILAYAPTEFYHCRHCEMVWGHVGLGQRLHREQQASQLPPDLLDEYTAISDWALDAFARYGERLSVKVVDAVSLEGVFKSLRYGSRHFPVFVVNGKRRTVGFDRRELDKALAELLPDVSGSQVTEGGDA